MAGTVDTCDRNPNQGGNIMTPSEDLVNADRGRTPRGQVPDEDLEGVTGGLLRPPDPSGYEDHRIGGRSDSGHDDTPDE